jgi:hypothetical protein
VAAIALLAFVNPEIYHAAYLKVLRAVIIRLCSVQSIGPNTRVQTSSNKDNVGLYNVIMNDNVCTDSELLEV